MGHRHPACGDEVVLSVRVEAGVLRAIRFDARGCVVSQAAAAMLCQHLEGRSLAEINAFSARDMLDLVSLPLSPSPPLPPPPRLRPPPLRSPPLPRTLRGPVSRPHALASVSAPARQFNPPLPRSVDDGLSF